MKKEKEIERSVLTKRIGEINEKISKLRAEREALRKKRDALSDAEETRAKYAGKCFRKSGGLPNEEELLYVAGVAEDKDGGRPRFSVVAVDVLKYANPELTMRQIVSSTTRFSDAELSMLTEIPRERFDRLRRSVLNEWENVLKPKQ